MPLAPILDRIRASYAQLNHWRRPLRVARERLACLDLDGHVAEAISLGYRFDDIQLWVERGGLPPQQQPALRCLTSTAPQ